MARLPDFREQEDINPQRMTKLVTSLERELALRTKPIGIDYAVEGATNGLRTLNVDTATLDEVRQFLATLIEDLIAQNKLRRAP